MLLYIYFLYCSKVVISLRSVSCQFVSVFWIFCYFIYSVVSIFLFLFLSISILFIYLSLFFSYYLFILSIFSVSIKCYKSEKKNNARQFNSNIKIKNIVKQKYKKCHIKQKVCKEKVKRKDFKVAKKEVQNDQEVPKNKCYQWRTQRSSSILHQEILVKQKFNDDH